MTIRHYQPGDEAAQASIFNEAAGGLPGFKPAQPQEIRKRALARDFDPATRFFAEDGGRLVGYCGFHPSGRVSFPWCKKGYERHAEPLFTAAIDAVKARGVRRAFAAYHANWPPPAEFFPAHGFPVAREMVNFIQELTEMPTLAAKAGSAVSELRTEDVPVLHAMVPELWRDRTPDDLGRYLLHNPYFPPESLFVLRNRADDQPVAVGLVVENPSYGDPTEGDPKAPCFRLGAFGTEEIPSKRINGLFSFVVPRTRSAAPLALDLMSHAAVRLDATTAHAVSAQAPTDVPHLLHFYQNYFRRQGSFPVYEKVLS